MGLSTFKRHSRAVTKTRRWQRLRVEALRRDDYRCRECGTAGRLEVDHIEPVRTHPALAFVLDNLQSLCASCHTHKTRTECGFAPVSPGRRAWRAFLNEPLPSTEHA